MRYWSTCLYNKISAASVDYMFHYWDFHTTVIKSESFEYTKYVCIYKYDWHFSNDQKRQKRRYYSLTNEIFIICVMCPSVGK